MYRYLDNHRAREAVMIGQDCLGQKLAINYLPYLAAGLFSLQLFYDNEGVGQLTNTNLIVLIWAAMGALYLFWSGRFGLPVHLYYFKSKSSELFHINSGHAIELGPVRSAYQQPLAEGETRPNVEKLHVDDRASFLQKLNWNGMHSLPPLPSRSFRTLLREKGFVFIGLMLFLEIFIAVFCFAILGIIAFLQINLAFALAWVASSLGAWWLERRRAPQVAAAVSDWEARTGYTLPREEPRYRRRWSNQPKKRRRGKRRR
ncbi:hypothetical protein [Salinicola avicenniae]|uniref:hypothetical protein n=1 Tax=Salinicola avicenniae TaxID=2916836 RepID=UPI00207378F4|nr:MULTISPECIES: hypothetical protein [unclassified Salinicola]